ncbi:MAG TPA: DUF6159 family protein [Rudaea sp.]|nr:DUF6159 family protein [Rudaea sp.]
MFERFSRSWELVKASSAVLGANKRLMIFPVLSSVCTLIVAASFFVPLLLGGAFGHFEGRHMTPGSAALLFVFYLVQYFVVIFFNSALVGAALIYLRGGNPTVGDGLGIAASKLPSILGYAVISATVGMVLRAIQERAGFIGSWIASLLGAAWTVATFLVVPVLVNRDIGPFDAVTHSVQLLKRTWGENLIGNAGIGLAFGLVTMLVVFTGVGLLILAVSTHSTAAVVLVAALLVAAILMLAVIQATLHGIYSAAVYRYAEEGDAGAQFSKALVAGAFRIKA